MSVFFDRAGFLERLEELRQRSDLSKGDFSKKAGVSQIFSRYAEPKPERKERKIKTPSTATLLQISKEFKVSVDWLLTGQEPKSDHPPPHIAELLSMTCEVLDNTREAEALEAVIKSMYQTAVRRREPGTRTEVDHRINGERRGALDMSKK